MLQLTTGKVFFETDLPLKETVLDLPHPSNNIQGENQGAIGQIQGVYLRILLALLANRLPRRYRRSPVS